MTRRSYIRGPKARFVEYAAKNGSRLSRLRTVIVWLSAKMYRYAFLRVCYRIMDAQDCIAAGRAADVEAFMKIRALLGKP